MTIPEILEALTRYTGTFPREAVAEAIAQREAIMPDLLRILEQDAATRASDPEYQAHLYAMYLLAQFREPRAYPVLVNFFSANGEWLYQAVGDVITEDLDRMLASTCQGDTSLIEQMIENPALDEYVRGAALGALVILVTQGVTPRDTVLGYFKSLFRGKLNRECSYVWASLISRCCDLYPEDMMVFIEQAYADRLVDTSFIGMNSVKQALSVGKESAMAKLSHDPRRGFIEDTIKEMAGWSCFTTPRASVAKTPPPLTTTVTPAPAPTVRKVGRNEPCPCGSGNKYKRCCGA
jgi:hypothetical protein